MKSKWFFSLLFLILFACFGAFQEKVNIPNQEIVLEFVDENINKEEINNTITNLKETLLIAGVANINIKETKNGTLKISYYSAVTVDNIKAIIAKENSIAFNLNSENNNKNLPVSDYKFDIYELANEVDVSDLKDKYLFEIKQTSDRFTTNPSLAFLKNIELKKANQLFKTALTANKKNPFTKDRTSHQEPEVRAGPNYCNS